VQQLQPLPAPRRKQHVWGTWSRPLARSSASSSLLDVQRDSKKSLCSVSQQEKSHKRDHCFVLKNEKENILRQRIWTPGSAAPSALQGLNAAVVPATATDSLLPVIVWV